MGKTGAIGLETGGVVPASPTTVYLNLQNSLWMNNKNSATLVEYSKKYLWTM